MMTLEECVNLVLTGWQIIIVFAIIFIPVVILIILIIELLDL